MGIIPINHKPPEMHHLPTSQPSANKTGKAGQICYLLATIANRDWIWLNFGPENLTLVIFALLADQTYLWREA